MQINRNDKQYILKTKVRNNTLKFEEEKKNEITK